MIHVVVGVIYNTHDQILIALRPPGKPFPGYWEFPGGKVERDEAPLNALHRELEEEIGIVVLKSEPFIQIEHHYEDRHIFLDVFHIHAFEGNPEPREGQVLKWIAREELKCYEFPSGNTRIVERLLKM